MAGVADPGAGAAVTAVDPMSGARRMAGPWWAVTASRRGLRPRGGRAHVAAQRPVGEVLAQRAAAAVGIRVAAAPVAAVSQRPQRHPARIAVAGIAGVAVPLGGHALIHRLDRKSVVK